MENSPTQNLSPAMPFLPMRPLRILLLFDSILLFLLGAALLLVPVRVERVFHFVNLPAGTGYMLGLWGCGMITMAFGYFAAALDPIRHLIWIKIGIARGFLEAILGLYYAAVGIISFGQGAFGIATASLVTIAYVVLYPRQQHAVPSQ